MNGSDPKQIARELLEEAHPALVGLSHWIHANPELGYEEVLASGWVAEWLVTAGFDVRTGVGGMPTAIVASNGPGPFHVAVCVEYDALPAVGHACGHNVIAAAGVGAGLALAAVAEPLGLRVTVLGTPAEESGGGKIGLIQAGALDGVHAAMMVHPWPQDEAMPSIIAIRTLDVTYTGREAHAAGFPHLGVNAGDALVVAQTAIALLRQQLLPTDRVHGIVTKGGDAPNVIPARTTAQWMVRGPDLARLDEVTALVRRCFEAGAVATGASVDIREEVTYADLRHDPALARLYQVNAEALGRTFGTPGTPVSTDMGNVSYLVPTIHPMIGIEAGGAVNHQAAFAAACATASADRAILDGALAMAWTAIDAARDEVLRARLMAFAADPDDVAAVSSRWSMPGVGVASPVVARVEVAARPRSVEELLAEAGAAGDADVLVVADLPDEPSAGAGSSEVAEPGADAVAIAVPEVAEPGADTVAIAVPEVAEPADDIWFSTEPEPEPAPIRAAEPASPDIAARAEPLPPPGLEPDPRSSAPAPAPASPTSPAPVVRVRAYDRGSWELAFESAVSRVGWQQAFEDAIRERMVGEGMDRSEAIADLAADLRAAAATPWPQVPAEQVSRDRIEAEGFAFVAPEVTLAEDDPASAWSRNGADAAGTDARIR
jgi:amidohydrolase